MDRWLLAMVKSRATIVLFSRSLVMVRVATVFSAEFFSNQNTPVTEASPINPASVMYIRYGEATELTAPKIVLRNPITNLLGYLCLCLARFVGITPFLNALLGIVTVATT